MHGSQFWDRCRAARHVTKRKPASGQGDCTDAWFLMRCGAMRHAMCGNEPVRGTRIPSFLLQPASRPSCAIRPIDRQDSLLHLKVLRHSLHVQQRRVVWRLVLSVYGCSIDHAHQRSDRMLASAPCGSSRVKPCSARCFVAPNPAHPAPTTTTFLGTETFDSAACATTQARPALLQVCTSTHDTAHADNNNI